MKKPIIIFFLVIIVIVMFKYYDPKEIPEPDLPIHEYSVNKVDKLIDYQREYLKADDIGRDSIAKIIVIEYADVNEAEWLVDRKINNEMYLFIKKIKSK